MNNAKWGIGQGRRQALTDPDGGDKAASHLLPAPTSFSSVSQLPPITLTHECQPLGCSPSLSPIPHCGPFLLLLIHRVGQESRHIHFSKGPLRWAASWQAASPGKNDLPPRTVQQTEKLRLRVFHQGASHSLANSLPGPSSPLARLLSQHSLSITRPVSQRLFHFSQLHLGLRPGEACQEPS